MPLFFWHVQSTMLALLLLLLLKAAPSLGRGGSCNLWDNQGNDHKFTQDSCDAHGNTGSECCVDGVCKFASSNTYDCVKCPFNEIVYTVNCTCECEITVLGIFILL